MPLVLFTIFYLLLLLSSESVLRTFTIAPVGAFTMEGRKYRLEVPDILGEKVRIQPLPLLKENPTIVRGLPTNTATEPFSFTVSSLLIDFGTIAPTDPVTRTANLIVNKGQVFGYRVFAFQDDKLENAKSGETIVDTTCDSGRCNEIFPSPWVNPLVFGFGFRLDDVQGTSSSNVFISAKKDSFAQFAKHQAQESPIPIMSNVIFDTRNDEARVTYKVNVSADQKEGVYQNIIYYVAIPNF